MVAGSDCKSDGFAPEGSSPSRLTRHAQQLCLYLLSKIANRAYLKGSGDCIKKIKFHYPSPLSDYIFSKEIDKNMHYILTNESEIAFVYYNCQNQISITMEEEKAHHFKMKTAKKVLANKTNEMLKISKIWNIVPCTAKNITGQNNSSSQIDIDNIPCLQSEIECVQMIVDQIQKLEEIRVAVSERESEFDKRLIDKYHEIEFSQCSASEGYKQYKELHELLVERRVVKNTSKIINDFMRSSISGVTTTATIAAINRLANQTYKKCIT